jgi:4-aminobutyrate aminotransferase
MPLGAMIARAEVMNWTPGAHASTFGGNPVCVAAALATIKLLEEQYISNAARIGDFILRQTANWRERHKIVGDIRGKGLMIGIEFVRDQKTKQKAPDLRNRIVQLSFERGLLLLGSGDTTLRICPPLIINEEQAGFAVRTLDEIITEVERSL